jgi:uncharacterized repeat protein (TIGR03847 family)
MAVIEFDPPDRFVAGTVGPPGQRTFFLQATSGPRVTSVSLEKEQVSVLADRVSDLLDDFAGEEPSEGAPPPVDNDPLGTPIEDEFRVSSLSLGWDAERRVVVVECHESEISVESDDDANETVAVAVADEQSAQEGSIVRVVIGASSAREFARRCASLVAAGRPPCPFCGGPLDPSGHICPRANGYKR